MFGSRTAAIALVVFAVVGLSTGAVRAQTPPIEAYGAVPAIDSMTLSPSGELIARIEVVNETRALAVTRIATGQHIFAASIGDAKVRDLSWIGEGRA